MQIMAVRVGRKLGVTRAKGGLWAGVVGDPYARQVSKSELMDGMEGDCARQRAQFYIRWL